MIIQIGSLKNCQNNFFLALMSQQKETYQDLFIQRTFDIIEFIVFLFL